MSLDSEQIVNSLISFYRRKGADLSYMLGDPLFYKLSVEDRVKAIQKNAKTLLEGVPEGLNSQEKSLIKGEVVMASLGGVVTGYSLARAVLSSPKYTNIVSRNKALALMGGSAILIGGLGGALIGKIKTDGMTQNRAAIREELIRTAKNPTVENAIGVLSAAPVYKTLSVSRENLLSKIHSKFDEMVQKPMVENLSDAFPFQYEGFKLRNPSPVHEPFRKFYPISV